VVRHGAESCCRCGVVADDERLEVRPRPAARDAGYPDWKRVVIGYDATEVINHPDKGKDAKDLFDDGELSGEAYRAAKGFDETDAPSEEERARSIGIKTHDSSLAWYGIPSVRTAIEPAPGDIESPAGTSDTPVASRGSEVEPGPPPDGEPNPREPITASAADLVAARILGAAEVAVDRCRELAGQRLVTKVRNEKCEPCLEKIEGLSNGRTALVASSSRGRRCSGSPTRSMACRRNTRR
jgi:hypothetical protein